MPQGVEERVDDAIEAWFRWVSRWVPSTHRTRARFCRRCAGSPFIVAGGIERDTPHQVIHALVARLQRIIDSETDTYTETCLPLLHAELTDDVWETGGYDPRAGLPPEYDGLDVDPEPSDAQQPYLFTLTGLAQASQPDEPLPRPPLTAEEKQQLRSEVERAELFAEQVGQEICFVLVGHRDRIASALREFVEPQIQELLNELARQLDSPQ